MDHSWTSPEDIVDFIFAGDDAVLEMYWNWPWPSMVHEPYELVPSTGKIVPIVYGD